MDRSRTTKIEQRWVAYTLLLLMIIFSLLCCLLVFSLKNSRDSIEPLTDQSESRALLSLQWLVVHVFPFCNICDVTQTPLVLACELICIICYWRRNDAVVASEVLRIWPSAAASSWALDIIMTSHTVLWMEVMMLRICCGRNVKLIRDGCTVQKPFIPFGLFYGIKKSLCIETMSVGPSFIHY